MILPILISLVLFSLCLILAGKYMNAAVFSILGFVLMFLIGITMINNPVEYQTGEIINNTLINVASTNQTVIVDQQMQYTYTEWEGDTFMGMSLKNLIGIYLAIASIMGLIVVVATHKAQDIKED
jgi:hypothetical protein